MSQSTLAQCLDTDYRLTGELTELYSYQDKSYLFGVANTTTGGKAHTFVVKLMHAGADPAVVEMQVHLLDTLNNAATHKLPMPGIARAVRTTDGRTHSHMVDVNGKRRIVWVASYLPGILAADQQPYTMATMHGLGEAIASMHRVLKDVEHPGLHNDNSWKLIDAQWIANHLSDLRSAFKEHADWLEQTITMFQNPDPVMCGKSAVEQLTAQAIHGDINEHNVIFGTPVNLETGEKQSINGIIDFGDAHYAPRICDLAIAATYFMMHQSNPWTVLEALVKGYHSISPLTPHEIDVLMPLVRMRLAQSLTHSMLNTGQSGNNDYVTISQAPALTLINQLKEFKDGFATYWVHSACGNNYLIDKQARITTALNAAPAAAVVDADLRHAPVLDLSPGSGHPVDPFSGAMPDPLEQDNNGNAVVLGRYGEPRLVYQSAEFRASAHPVSLSRTIHAGVDVFMKAGSAVFAPCDAVVHALENRTLKQDYGPVIVLKHLIGDDHFYTLYGHLNSECLSRLSVGQTISRGQRIAYIGAPPENGDWPPHLHFQWILDDLGWGTDVNGVCHHFTWPVWQQYFPNPAVLLGCANERVGHTMEDDQVLVARRDARLGKNLSVAYSTPVQIVRGWQQYLYDQHGRCFLDAYNNVPHVGHCHPRVVKAVAKQMQTLSTNTRYLHKTILDYADALTARFDERLEVCFVVNSASEANELALRLARNFTQAKDLIVIQDAYHGHTTSLIDISPYKAEGRGGLGCPDWVHQVPAVDLYRGKYGYDERHAGRLYAQDVKQVIRNLERPLCGFICESLPSVGGQLVFPDGYLTHVYAHVRKAGGVCIADEVQTGFGRTGDHFWGFEQQRADPDIVVLGKPIGNGFPLAAVVTTSEIAHAFDNGMEFFSTFGGNTVACAAGLAVLDVIEHENVQAHIKDVGDYLKGKLKAVIGDHPLVGDIRGMGLFLGVELVSDKTALTPATQQAAYIKNRLRDLGILIGSDGPYDSVLKIRPPSPFNHDDADFLVERLAFVLNDTALRLTR